MASVIIGDYEYTTMTSSTASVKVVDTSKRTYQDMESSVVIGGATYLVTSLESCFAQCYSMASAPTLSANAIDMTECFYKCIKLTQATIPNGVTTLKYCFRACEKLVQAPTIPNSVTDMYGCFASCTVLEQAPTIPNSVTDMSSCFSYCYALTQAPSIPSSVRLMLHCFQSCKSLTQPPIISDGVTDMYYCFNKCTALEQAPSIPSSVRTMASCFAGCTLLSGNVVVHNNIDPSASYGAKNMFAETSENIFIVSGGQSFQGWKDIASGYQNVHYEADDNPIPTISDFTATRVSAVGSTDYAPTGLYAYIKANVMVYDVIPVGWTNELKGEILTDNGTVESATWQPSQITEYPTDIWCWISLGDTSSHTITLQISDSIKDNGTEVKTQSSSVLSKTITKSYALVDYYHDDVTGTEGMSIGKYAEYPDLLDVDMPTLFRQGLSLVDGESVIRTILDYMRPIGSTYSTIDSTFDPNVVWGGTWEKLPEGYVLLSGSESGSYIVGDDTSTGSGFKEYGANTRRIEDTNIAHGHGFTNPSVTGGSHNHAIASADKYFLTTDKSPDKSVSRRTIKNGTGSNLTNNLYCDNPVTRTANTDNTSHTHTVSGGAVGNLGTPSSRANFNIMQKSIAVYWWIRTA